MVGMWIRLRPSVGTFRSLPLWSTGSSLSRSGCSTCSRTKLFPLSHKPLTRSSRNNLRNYPVTSTSTRPSRLRTSRRWPTMTSNRLNTSSKIISITTRKISTSVAPARISIIWHMPLCSKMPSKMWYYPKVINWLIALCRSARNGLICLCLPIPTANPHPLPL